MAAPDVEVRKFSGLYTSVPNDEGDFAQLIVADNVQFNRAGQIEGRRGFHWNGSFDTFGLADFLTGSYLGRFNFGSDFTVEGHHTFQIGERFFYWFPPSSGTISYVYTPGETPSSRNKGVQYGGFMYFTDGHKWDGTDYTDTAGFPGQFGPMEAHNERVWCVNDSRLYFSAVGDGNSWPGANFIDVEPGTGEMIVDLRSFRNRLYIFKHNSVWVLDTPGVPTSWVLRRVSDDSCYFQTSVEYEGAMYWFGSKGAYRHDGNTIEVISDPIQDVWDSAEPYLFNVDGEGPDTYSYSTAFNDMWIVCVGLNFEQRVFCYHTKFRQWTEWKFNWVRIGAGSEDDAPFIRGMWADHSNSRDEARGIYMLIEDTPKWFIVGAHPDFSELDPNSVDTTGIPESEELAYPFEPVIQTKFSDFKEPFNKKRCLQWMMEFKSHGLEVQQIDEEGRSVTQVIDAVSGDHAYQRRIRGIGYFRKLSLRIVFKLPTETGWNFQGLFAKMRSRGPQIKNAEEL